MQGNAFGAVAAEQPTNQPISDLGHTINEVIKPTPLRTQTGWDSPEGTRSAVR